MINLIEEIAKTDAFDIDRILNAVLDRYAVLFPDWELGTISLRKSADQNEQLDRMIAFLQNLKNK